MKKILKLLLLAVAVFWGTNVILVAKSSVEEYISNHKEEAIVIETTAIISKKGGGFVEYIVKEINTISVDISTLKTEIEAQKDSSRVKMNLVEIAQLNDKLEAVKDKKEFLNLDLFRNEVTIFNTLVRDYIGLCEEYIIKNTKEKYEEASIKEKEILETKLKIEKLVETFEIN
ncbi:hypothetical protein [uncultured Clostridium sp.]|jgi:hypothetical protein|uniref:hypothetical protein n=1 Tax=uncultured Clostridium sp. TaxID=59620 RepID=UPI0026128FE4|nr:hypothetical protein [uncultured Clostridium sp.]